MLTINATKTNYVIFSAIHKNTGSDIQLKINDKIINQKSSEKYLGLILDNHLKWRPHLDKIKLKLASLTGMLYGVTKCLPRPVRYLVYNSLVKPQLEYLIEIWGSASKKYLDIIQIAQNKLIKILFNYNYLTHTDKIYKETRIMNIKQLYRYFTCIIIHKILNKNININFNFIKKSSVHKMQLRNSSHLVTYKCRTNYGKKTIKYEGIKLYNELPKFIKDSETSTTFKKRLKLYILDDN